MVEVWKQLNEVTGYSISNLGRIRRDTKDVLMPNGFYRHLEEKIMALNTSNRGYYRVTIHRKHYNIHRLVAKYFVDNPNNRSFVNHIDGDKKNNVFTNLEWVTPKENTNHALRTGLMHLYGEIYDEVNKDLIKRLINLGVKPYLISKIFKYSNGQIYYLMSKYKWRNPYKGIPIPKAHIPYSLYKELLEVVPDNTELTNLIAKGRIVVQSIETE